MGGRLDNFDDISRSTVGGVRGVHSRARSLRGLGADFLECIAVLKAF